MEVCGSGAETIGGAEANVGGGVIHGHCANCVRLFKCTARPRPGSTIDCCEIVSCEAECGARYHACKGREHRLLCANEKVPCINSVSGCPVWMFRRLLGRHLRTCPASVVHCTMEWNRWPVCSSERKLHIPFHQPNPNARAGQLDVALALRDQRMLNEWLSAPRRTRRALRNSLTRRFPAVPLQLRGNGMTTTIAEGASGGVGANDSENSSAYPSRGMTDDEEDTPWEARKAPPGLQRSVCGELYRASKQATDSLTAALNIITNHATAGANVNANHQSLIVNGEQPQLPVGNGWVRYYGHHDPDKENRFGRSPVVASANGSDRKRWSSSADEDVDAVVEDMDVERCPPFHLPSSGRFGSPPVTLGLMSSSALAETMDLGLEVEVSGLRGYSEACGYTEAYDEAPGGYDILFVNHTVVSEISSASMTDHARKPPAVVAPVPPSALASLVTTAPPPPPTSPPLFVNLGLDLTLESITRYQTKPKSMYTFLCAQEFRRDEFGWHYKNVHSDIHGGLNGWIEQRCPLAHYGCMHSVRRFYPSCCGSSAIAPASVVHNDILESFGVRPHIPHLQPLSPARLTRLSPVRASPERRTSPRAIDHGKNSGLVVTCPMEVILENGAGSINGAGSPAPLTDEDGDECESVSSLNGPLLLTQLPFEVLQHVARFLDSFSMSNLSMTTRLLRDVCCSLLEERGIVVQQWERIQIRNKYSWRIAYKRWFFSTAFTPIRQWGFEEQENMSNHLKKCLYNQREEKIEPWFYPVGIHPNPHILEKLKAGIERTLRKDPAVTSDTTTKL